MTMGWRRTGKEKLMAQTIPVGQSILPENQTHHFVDLEPDDIFAAIERGIDTFDC